MNYCVIENEMPVMRSIRGHEGYGAAPILSRRFAPLDLVNFSSTEVRGGVRRYFWVDIKMTGYRSRIGSLAGLRSIS